jgi:hypothetical protein
MSVYEAADLLLDIPARLFHAATSEKRRTILAADAKSARKAAVRID